MATTKARSGKQYTSTGPLADTDARKAAKVVNRLFREYEEVTPQLLVTVAEEPSCPIHHLFNWDDASAGAAWRLHQARWILASVKEIEVETAPPVRSYHAIKIGKARSQYYQREVVLSDEAKLARLEETYLARVRSAWEAACGMGLSRKEPWKTIGKLC